MFVQVHHAEADAERRSVGAPQVVDTDPEVDEVGGAILGGFATSSAVPSAGILSRVAPKLDGVQDALVSGASRVANRLPLKKLARA